MQNNIKVSVIIPVYNVGRFLGKCIDTVITQTYKNLEIILVDDGSMDNSGELCDQYSDIDKRIRVIHQDNMGVSAARNAGIDMATGEYICFVDGDDFVMPDYVEYMLGLAVKNNADISLTTEMYGNYQRNQIRKDKIEIWSGEEAVVGILCYRIPIGVYCKLFRRDFLGKHIRFLTELFIGEGFNFNTTAFQHTSKIVAGHRKTYFYRRDNPVSATTKFSVEKWENGIMAIDRIKENLLIHSKEIDYAWKYARWRTYTDVYDLMVLADVRKQYPVMYKRCLNVTRHQALWSLRVPISSKDRMRAMVMMVCPRLIPMLMVLRRLKYHVDVKN